MEPLRLQYISDIHLEFRDGFKMIPSAPYLAVLGDLCVFAEDTQMLQKTRNFFLEYSSKYVKIFYIAGNHEFYNCVYEDALARIQAMCNEFSNIYFLERAWHELPGNWVLAGCTMWTHVSETNRKAVEQGLNDYRMIARKDPPRMFTVEDTNALHNVARTFLTESLQGAQRTGKKLVILTHHCPFCGANRDYLGSPTNDAFEVNMGEFMQPPVAVWLYGHTHYTRRDVIQNIPVLSNQIGYRDVRWEYQRSTVWDSTQPLKDISSL